MIDAHLLLNLGRGAVDTPGLVDPTLALPDSGKAGKFAEALRQVHAEGRQEFAGAPMQLRIIGSTLRVVTPAKSAFENPMALPESDPSALPTAPLSSEAANKERESASPAGIAQPLASMEQPLEPAEPSGQPPLRFEGASEAGSPDPLENGEAPQAEAIHPSAAAGVPPAMTPSPQASVAQAPVTQVPVAPAPAAEAPVAQAPVTQAPVAQAPVTQAPVAQAPVAQTPVAQVPVAQTPVAQVPVAEAPAVPAELSGGALGQPPNIQPSQTDAPRARVEGTKPPESSVQAVKAPVIAGAAAALGLREALKGNAEEAVNSAPPVLRRQESGRAVPVQPSSGWSFKEALGAQRRAAEPVASKPQEGASKALARSAGLQPAGNGESAGSPVLGNLERRELDLVALARTAPGVEGEAPELTEKFAAQLAQRVVAQAAAGQLTSRIALNPAQLGPLEIRLQLDGERIAVEFQAHHALTRELIGDGLGRLREGLEQAGFDVARLTTEGRSGGMGSNTGQAGQEASAFAQPGAEGERRPASQNSQGKASSEVSLADRKEGVGSGQVDTSGDSSGLDITV